MKSVKNFSDLPAKKKGNRSEEHHFSRNQIVKTIQQPGENESAIDAKRRGFR
ncbi:hypothetical protein [Oceanirhabdus sp. W0125-5]|uniref:hypothetical protein n=1 Tax=Oceanirhabdus sp. W0125-5 TaxID=2999116 RepID=UPI0022F34294|nr:hypothetical protein [Oceanirhabdus sp. W0125-5]WBW95563.1 hypothetical protein OW730_17945 [Oceanirhabdus sp. W0125-5]